MFKTIKALRSKAYQNYSLFTIHYSLTKNSSLLTPHSSLAPAKGAL